jgi:hypothetical protein
METTSVEVRANMQGRDFFVVQSCCQVLIPVTKKMWWHIRVKYNFRVCRIVGKLSWNVGPFLFIYLFAYIKMLLRTYLQRRITESVDTLKSTIRHLRTPGLWFEPHIRYRHVIMQLVN